MVSICNSRCQEAGGEPPIQTCTALQVDRSQHPMQWPCNYYINPLAAGRVGCPKGKKPSRMSVSGGLAHSVERSVRNRQAGGSKPPSSTTFFVLPFRVMTRQRVRVVKELVLKANGLCPREFKSRRCRLIFAAPVGHWMHLWQCRETKKKEKNPRAGWTWSV